MARIDRCLMIALAAMTSGFKPNTHMHSANLVAGGPNGFEFDGKTYPLRTDVIDAIKSKPNCYRAGVVGPDGFPDIIFGQSLVHPKEDGYTHEWLNHVYERGSERKRTKCEKAFTFGYLTHAAGDLWAHTLVNQFSGGVFPGPTEIAQSPPKGQIALRHMILEGYVGDFTPGTQTSLDAPNAFVRDTFITDSPRSFDTDTFCDDHRTIATPLAAGSHFAELLKLRRNLCEYRKRVDAIVDEKCVLDPTGISCTKELVQAAKYTYLTAWVSDIDQGLDEWPQMAEDIARNLFDPADPDTAFDDAKETAADFFKSTLLSMLGAPDVVGHVLHLADAVSEVLTELNPLTPLLDELKAKFLDWIFRDNFGISYTDLKAKAKHPACHVDDPSLFPVDTSLKLDVLMTGDDVARVSCLEPPPRSYDVETFATFKNATTLSKLLLMSPQWLDAMLFDMSVGSLYTGGRLPSVIGAPKAELMQKNAMLGYAFTIDGNHAWRKKAPDFEAGGLDAAGEGMPLWRDCLAHRRAFLRLFADSTALGLVTESNYDGCEILSNPLPPLSVLPKDKGPSITTCCFGSAVKIVNHQDHPQRYFFYYRVRQQGVVRFHSVTPRIGDDALEPLASRIETFGLGTCNPGSYDIDLFVFDWMAELPAESPKNLHVPLTQPYWTEPVKQWTINVVVPPESQCDATPCEGQQGTYDPPPYTPGSEPGDPFHPAGDAVGVGGGGSGLRSAPPQETGAGCCCTSGPWAALDADGDGVPDDQDNCPLQPNPIQTVRPCGSGSTPPAAQDEEDVAYLTQRFLELDTPDFALIARMKAVVRSGALDRRYQEPKDPCLECPTCFTCPRGLAGVDRLLRAEAATWHRRKLDADAAFRTVEAIATKLRYATYGASVMRGAVDPRTRQLTYRIASKRGGALSVNVPAAVFRGRPRVQVNGRWVRPKLSRRGGVTSVFVRVPRGTSTVKIGGRR